MPMALLLPGWNSVEAASKWHRGFEIAGFVALGLLLLFEVLAYRYGNRRDSLSVAAELDAARGRQTQEEIANLKRDQEIAEAQREAKQAKDSHEAAQIRIDELTATRKLSDEQKQTLTKALSPYKGSQIIIAVLKGARNVRTMLTSSGRGFSNQDGPSRERRSAS